MPIFLTGFGSEEEAESGEISCFWLEWPIEKGAETRRVVFKRLLLLTSPSFAAVLLISSRSCCLFILATSPSLEPPSLGIHLELSLGKSDGSPFFLSKHCPDFLFFTVPSPVPIYGEPLAEDQFSILMGTTPLPSRFWTNATFLFPTWSGVAVLTHMYLSFYLPKALTCIGLMALLTILPIQEWALLCASVGLGVQWAL